MMSTERMQCVAERYGPAVERGGRRADEGHGLRAIDAAGHGAGVRGHRQRVAEAERGAAARVRRRRGRATAPRALRTARGAAHAVLHHTLPVNNVSYLLYRSL